MRLYNVGLPGTDNIPGFDPLGENAHLSIRMDPIPEGGVYLRIRDVTVDTDGSAGGLEFKLVSDSGDRRVRVYDGEGQSPPRFDGVDADGEAMLYVYYGNGNEGSQDGLFEATIEYSFDGESWAPLSQWPGEYTVFSGGFLAADSGGAELCFWTRLVLTTQECERPPQPTNWFGRMENYFSFATSPDTIGHYGTAYSGYAGPPGFSNGEGGASAYNNSVFARTGAGFLSEYGANEASFDPEYSNLRIIKISPETGGTLETTPIPGTFPGVLKDQATGFREQSYWADFTGTLPPFEPGFWYGFIADLTCTPNGSAPPGTAPFTVEISGSYSYDVRVLQVPGAQQAACTFSGPSLNTESGGYAGYTWAYNKYDQPCGGVEDVDGIYDGSPVVISTTFSCT